MIVLACDVCSRALPVHARDAGRAFLCALGMRVVRLCSGHGDAGRTRMVRPALIMEISEFWTLTHNAHI